MPLITDERHFYRLYPSYLLWIKMNGVWTKSRPLVAGMPPSSLVCWFLVN